MNAIALDAVFALIGAGAGVYFAATVNAFDDRPSLRPVHGLRAAYWTLVAAGAVLAVVLRHRPPAGRAVFEGRLDVLGLIASAATLYLLVGLAAIVLTGQMWSMVPDRITLPGIAIGLAVALFVPRFVGSIDLRGLPPAIDSFASSVAGAALGAGIFISMRWLYWRMQRREGLGIGCIKLAAFAGAFTGPEELFLTMLGASVVGAAYAIFGQVAEAVWRDFRFDPVREVDFSSLLAFFGIVSYFAGEAFLRLLQ